jgi:hypothetical protein
MHFIQRDCVGHAGAGCSRIEDTLFSLASGGKQQTRSYYGKA